MNQVQSELHSFRLNTRVLRLLGDELIRDASIAIFELVKNAYDADASKVEVTLDHVAERHKGIIAVEDDGCGMDWDTVVRVWLELGTDFRRRQVSGSNGRSPKFGRLPLGEKGVGRFAVGKLGDDFRLITRSRDNLEVVVHFAWTSLLQQERFEDVAVPIRTREPEVFTDGRTGTRIEIRRLREDWTRDMVRSVYRSLVAIRSPFSRGDDFSPSLKAIPDDGWLSGLLEPETVLEHSLFRVRGEVRGALGQGNVLSYEYEFVPPPGMDRVSPRTVTVPEYLMPDRAQSRGRSSAVQLSFGRPGLADHAIGKVSFELHIFDLESVVLGMMSVDRRGLRDFLKNSGGIRVYRDGVRVYNYGEPGEDWLDLGGRRVNVPTSRLSNNLVIGAFSLDLASSQDLVEKTNREGFVENAAFHAFKDAVSGVVDRITTERNSDKIRIRNVYRKHREGVVESIDALREVLRQRGWLEYLEQEVNRVEQEYIIARDRLLTSAGAGLALTVVVHEVEKGIDELKRAVDRNSSGENLRELATHLSELVDGFTYLTRRSGRSVETASVLAKQALFNIGYRLRYHNVEVVNGFYGGDDDFRVRCTRRLVVATLMNLFDNSIYWMNQKGPARRRLYVGPCRDLFDGPALVVADNGPGFLDSPEFLVEPLITNKPDGMGLGLYVADEVMKAHDGRLAFPGSGTVSLPGGFDGAVVALVFKEG